MKYDLTVFQEPRGVMRIFQLIFALCALYTTWNFDINVTVHNGTQVNSTAIEFPFKFGKRVCSDPTSDRSAILSADVSSDARFFVATCVLSILYALFISAVYAAIDEIYTSKPEVPLADFILTAVLAIFWLAGAAAWSNGTSALKTVTDPVTIQALCGGKVTVLTSSFSRLNISLLFGYLNFFLWASDLWFLYKETHWFKERQQPNGEGGVGSSTMNAPNI